VLLIFAGSAALREPLWLVRRWSRQFQGAASLSACGCLTRSAISREAAKTAKCS